MRNSKSTVLAMALLSMMAFITPSSYAALIGSTWGGALFDISETTGSATVPALTTTGLATLIDIEFVGNTLYGLTTYNDNSLYTIDPVTGAYTLVGSTGLHIIEGDLAYNPSNGILYGLWNYSETTKDLFTLDLSNGSATIIGSLTGMDDPSGLAFDASGTMYVTDSNVNNANNSYLYTIDPATAAILTAVDLSIDLDVVHGLDFDPATGMLYALDKDNLYSLSTDGIATLIGPTWLDRQFPGLTVTPETAPVPEPSTILLLGSGLLGLGWYGRKRKKA